jgi:hypothetical protein
MRELVQEAALIFIGLLWVDSSLRPESKAERLLREQRQELRRSQQKLFRAFVEFPTEGMTAH